MKRTVPLVLGGVAVAAHITATALRFYSWHVLDSEFGRELRVEAFAVIATASWVLTVVAGTTILRHRPRHLAGWMLLLAALTTGLASFANSYVWFGYVVDRFGTTLDVRYHLPALAHAGWAYGTLAAMGAALTVLFVLFFPHGTLPDKRWKATAAVVVAVFGLNVIVAAFSRAAVASSVVLTANPLRIEALDVLSRRLAVGGATRPLVILAADAAWLLVVALTLTKLIGAAPELRRAMRLFGGAVVLLASVTLVDLASFFTGDRSPIATDVAFVLRALALTTLGVATIDAVFRSRLHQIEAVVRRTTIVGGMALFIGAVYVAATSVAGGIAGQVAGGWFIPMSATAVAAVGLRPVWDASERLAARTVIGDRPGMPTILEAVVAGVASARDVDDVLPNLAATLRTTTGASSVVIRREAQAEAITIGEASERDDALRVAVRFGSRMVGEIVLTRRPSEPWTAEDRDVLGAVAAQAGPAFHNAVVLDHLRQELNALDVQMAVLEASQRRIATAQLDARARFANDITMLVIPELDAVDDRIISGRTGEARMHAERALAMVRAIGHGLEPSELRDLGVAPALIAEARERGVSLRLTAGENAATRWSPPVEAALFSCLSAVLRTSGTRHASVSFGAAGGGVAFDASVDGGPLDRHVALDLEDRLAAIGGELTETIGETGMRLQGWVPGEGDR